jgi:hypothetical protein
MLNSGLPRSFLTRAIFASAVACLFALQGLVTSTGPRFVDSHAAASSVVSADASELCDTRDGDGNPARRHHDHSHCCISCNQSGRDASVVFIATLLCVALYSPPETSVTVLRLFADDFDRRPTGWIGSWSARAPPSFS